MSFIAERLAARGRQTPMLFCEGRETRTEAFHHAVAAAAEQLSAGGETRGRISAWLGLNSVAMLAHFAACQQQGMVWMPMNWRLAVPELRAQLRHAGASHLVHDAAHAAIAESLRADLQPGDAPAIGVEAGDAMLIYTSGTTGEPKGALHTQAGMAANADAAIAVQGLGPQTRALAVLPLFHVGGLAIQVLPTLAAGGQVLLHPRFDAAAWFDDVAAWRPDTCLMVPAVMRALVEHPRWPHADLRSLRFITAGSQIVPPALIEAFHARGIPVAQVYGATETGPVSLVLRPEEAMQQPGRSGRAAPGVQVRLGAEGEIQLRAPNLMRGYHRQAAPSFDADGFFATGDLAVEHPGGWFEVVGRSKEIIISGGENIHPAEIENLVLGWPGVADCAVVGVPDAAWGEVPVLALIAQPGAEPDLAGLRQVFELRLARFKHPRRIVQVSQLPRTALGKVQRRVLARQLEEGA